MYHNGNSRSPSNDEENEFEDEDRHQDNSRLRSKKGSDFMITMSKVFDVAYQFKRLQSLKSKLFNNSIYGTYLGEKMKESFGLRGLPSLEECLPLITFTGESDDDLSFTIIYFNSPDLSPIPIICRNYFGQRYISLMNDVYGMIYHNNDSNQDDSRSSSVISGQQDLNQDADQSFDRYYQEIDQDEDQAEEEQEEEFDGLDVPATSKQTRVRDDQDNDHGDGDNNQTLEKLLNIAKNTTPSPVKVTTNRSILEMELTNLKSTSELSTKSRLPTPLLVVRNPTISSSRTQNQNNKSSNSGSNSNYSIKVVDHNKIILQRPNSSNNNATMTDVSNLPGRGLRDHLIEPSPILYQDKDLQYQDNDQDHGMSSRTPSPNSNFNTNDFDNSSPPRLIVDDDDMSHHMTQSMPLDMSPMSKKLDRNDADWLPNKSRPNSSGGGATSSAIHRHRSFSNGNYHQSMKYATAMSPTSLAAMSPMRTPGRPRSSDSSSNSINSRTKKKFICNFKNCGKSFMARSHLDTHQVTHTGEKKFVCKECGGKFTQSSSLRNHRIAVHTKDYPHVCSTCNKGFLLPSQLRKHKEIHHNAITGSAGNNHHNHRYSSNKTAADTAKILAAKILATAKSNAAQSSSSRSPIVPPLPVH